MHGGGFQPYKRNRARTPGPALLNMMRGSTQTGYNPMDISRNAQRMVKAGKGRKRPPRPPR